MTVTVKPGQQEILPGITDNPNAESVGGAIGNSCSDPAASAEFVRDCTALINAATSNDPNAGLALQQITPQAVSSALDISESSAQSQTSSVNARLFSLRSGVGVKGINLDRLRLNIQRGGWTLSGRICAIYWPALTAAVHPAPRSDNDRGAFGVFASGSINLGSKDETENQADLISKAGS